jgi:hypothetical protein
LWALLGGPCFRRELRSSTVFESCLLFGVGSEHAEAEHYLSRNDAKQRLWSVLGPKVQLGRPFTPWLSGFIGVSCLGHLTRQSFSVEDVGIVAQAPSVAFLLGAGLRVESLLF